MWKWQPESHSQICQLHVPGSHDYSHESFSLCLESTTSTKNERHWCLSFVLFPNLHYIHFLIIKQTLWKSLINEIYHFWIVLHVCDISSLNRHKYGHWSCTRLLVPTTGAPQVATTTALVSQLRVLSKAIKLLKRRFVYTIIAVR